MGAGTHWELLRQVLWEQAVRLDYRLGGGEVIRT